MENGWKPSELSFNPGSSSWRQSNIESPIRSFKKILKASLLPGLPGITSVSFARVVQLSAATMNPCSICILPYAAARPGELLCASPQSHRGPDHAQWTSMGAARHYTGQLNVIASQQASFKKAFKIHYKRRLRKTHHMAADGMRQFAVGDIVFMADFFASDRQPPYPVLGLIHDFMDPLQAQAVVHYGAGRTVNRALLLLTRLVPAQQQIKTQGLLFDP